MTALRLATIFSTLLLAAAPAFGQAEIVPEDNVAGATDKDVRGLNPSLSIGGTLNLVNNTNVVGQVEGTSVLVGVGATGGIDYIRGKSVWRTSLAISESFAKTPVVDRFLKTNDTVALTSTYNYFLAPRVGLFAQGKVSTSLFSSRAITADDETYVIASDDAGGATRMVTTDDLRVSSAFKPFTLGYSGGAFSEPLTGKKLSLRVSGGLGGRHTIASDVLVNNDDDTTPEIELQELTNVHQLGAEVFAGISGKVAKEDRVSYAAGVSVLLPFVNNDEFNRSASDLMRVAAEASVTVGVFDWMGLVYKGSLVRDPQLFPDGEELTQFQNSLLLTFQYTLIDRRKGLAALKKQAALEEEKRKRAEADKRAKEAEERAKRLEEELEKARQETSKPIEPPPAEPPADQPPPTPTDAGPQGGDDRQGGDQSGSTTP